MALFRGFYVRGIACGLGSVLLAIAFGVSSADAQQPNPPPASPESSQGTILLTIFLKHDNRRRWSRSTRSYARKDSIRHFRRRAQRSSAGT
jgi:hypothetical protein